MQNLLTTEEINRLRNCQSETEWNNICDDLKRARNGQYPEDWWAKVMMSGLARDVQARWRR